MSEQNPVEDIADDLREAMIKQYVDGFKRLPHMVEPAREEAQRASAQTDTLVEALRRYDLETRS